MKERNLRKTNIVCTIGPAVENRMDELMKAGMSIARINFSHGDFEEQKDKIERFFAIDIPAFINSSILFSTAGPIVHTIFVFLKFLSFHNNYLLEFDTGRYYIIKNFP